MFRGTTSGFGEIQALLARLPERAGPAALQAALRETAQPTADMAGSLCPRSLNGVPGRRKIKGHLADNIQVFDAAPGDKAAAVVVSYPRRFFYGHFLEWGARVVRGGYSKVFKSGKMRGKGKQVGYQPARPFLRPAWDATKGNFLPRFGAAMWARLSAAMPSGWNTGSGRKAA